MSDQAKTFELDVGTWDGEIDVRPHPGAEPLRSKGVMVSRMVGGRWIVSDFRNETTGFEGHGIFGWDDGKQAYVATWVDATRGSLVIGMGSMDPSARTMTFRYELARGGNILRWRDVNRFIDDDTQEFRSFIEIAPGTEHEVVSARYRRRQS